MTNWIPGINCNIASKEQYLAFIDKLSQSLEDASYITSSFAYGSTARSNPIHGKSDIDAVFVLDYDSLKNPKYGIYEDLGRRIQNVHNSVVGGIVNWRRPTVIPLQFSFTDSKLVEDGRLVSYTSDFTHQFTTEGRTMSGIDFDNGWFKTNYFKLPLEARLAFNLAKTRQRKVFGNTLFSSDEDRISSTQSGVNNYLRALSEVGNIFVPSNQHQTTRAGNLGILEEMQAPLDVDFIKRLKEISSNSDSWIEETKKDSDLLDRCLRELEQLCWWYVDLPTEERTVTITVPTGIQNM